MSLPALESTINAAFDARDDISTATKGEVRDAVESAVDDLEELSCRAEVDGAIGFDLVKDLIECGSLAGRDDQRQFRGHIARTLGFVAVDVGIGARGGFEEGGQQRRQIGGIDHPTAVGVAEQGRGGPREAQTHQYAEGRQKAQASALYGFAGALSTRPQHTASEALLMPGRGGVCNTSGSRGWLRVRPG